ncbi:MAG: ABC transporter ATP-binding protein [Actinomycetota bacterium]
MAARQSGGGARSAMRSLTRDPAVKDIKLKQGTIKRIWSFAKPFKFYLSIFIFTIVIDSLLTVATPLILKSLIDNGVVPKNGRVVTELALLVGLLAIIDTGVSLAARWFSSRIGEGLIYEMRTQVFEHIQKQSIAFFTRTQTGALISRINSDVMGAQNAFTDTLSGILSNILTLTLVAAAMITLSWQITVASLALLPLFLIPTKWVGKKIQRLTLASFNLNAEMASTMTERFNVSGALLVTLYGKPAKEREGFRSKARRVADIGIKTAMLNRIFFMTITTIAAIATAFAYGIGGHLAISGAITIGSLLAITTLLARLYGPLTSLTNVRVDVMTALVSFERVFEVLDLEPMVHDKDGAVAVASLRPSIEFDHVQFSYPTASEISLASLELAARSEMVDSGIVLEEVSFYCEPGSLTAIVGPSGAGKSTISGLVPRLYDVTQGSIKVAGVDIRDISLASLRNEIGVVTQDSHMFHDTIEANLRYAKLDATDEEMQRACEAAQIWSFIQTLPNGLNTIVGERGHRLSGGERQRLAIARLLLKAPSIVILDEATAHLDSENEALVQAALEVALQGRTSIVIAHRLSTIQKADQILVLEAGRIVERGTHEYLVGLKGLYFDLYQRQVLNTAL